MVKVVTFLKRKPGMSVADFQHYWRGRHPEVVVALPGVRRYAQSHVLASSYAGGEPRYDGIAEVWADDTDALRTMTRSPHYARVQADEANFIDRATMGYVVTEDHVVKDGVVLPGGVKIVEFLTRRPGLSVEEFQRYWRDVHGPISARVPGVRRAVQSHTRRSAYETGRAPAWDGVALAWFDSADTLGAAAATPEHEQAVTDRAAFLAPGTPPALLTLEHVIVG